MAITFVNSVGSSVTGTVLTLPIPGGGPVAGNLLVLGVRLMAGVSLVSITDTLGHDWSAAVPENPFAIGSSHVDYVFYVGKCLGGADTITITTSSSALICGIVQEMGGYGVNGATLDGHNAGTGTGTTVDSGTVNTVDALACAVAFYSGVTSSGLNTDGTPNNWSNREGVAGVFQSFDQEFTSTQTGVRLHGTRVASDGWGAMIASFKAAPSAVAEDDSLPILPRPMADPSVVTVWG